MRLDALLSYKLKQESSEMCGFVRTRMSQEVVRSNSLPPCCPCDKGVRIQKRPYLTHVAVMALIAPWWGLTVGILTGKTGSDDIKDLDMVREIIGVEQGRHRSWRISGKLGGRDRYKYLQSQGQM